jgi:hypothetical protein
MWHDEKVASLSSVESSGTALASTVTRREEVEIAQNIPPARIYLSDVLPSSRLPTQNPVVHVERGSHMAPAPDPIPDVAPNPLFSMHVYSDYSEDELYQCRGRYSCTNCDRAIATRIFLMPKKQTREGKMYYDAAPYCRVACVYRGLLEMKNHFDYLSLFVLVYGAHVRPAPPRRLLKIKGGLSLEAYHQAIEGDRQWTEEATEHIRPFVCPVYMTSTLMQGNTPSTLCFLGGVSKQDHGSMGPLPDRTTRQSSVTTLHSKPVLDTSLASVFPTFPV